MNLHILGLPHTITRDEFSHCAFTGKILKFTRMMRRYSDHKMIHYGVEGAETSAHEQVDVITEKEFNDLRGHDGSNKTKFYSDDVNSSSKLYVTFNKRLREILRSRVLMDDLILMPFGSGHQSAVIDFKRSQLVESGIGYPNLGTADHKIFDSYTWMHYHQGKEKRDGKTFEWVIPNYFDPDNWDVHLNPDMDRVVFLGRISQTKGLDVIWQLAKRRKDLTFEICGQGNPSRWISKDIPNLIYKDPISGRDRSDYLGNARAVLAPSQYTEPFCEVVTEAQMCGTPAITTDFGAFAETVENGKNGFRCKTLGDYLAALDRCSGLNRRYIAKGARDKYEFSTVSAMYDRAFQQIQELRFGTGWFSLSSDFWR